MFTNGSKVRGGTAYRQGQAVKDLVKWRDNYTCQLCGRQYPDVPIEVDHIIPHAKGGLSIFENMRVLCVDCNRATRRPKQAPLPLNEYYEALEMEAYFKDWLKPPQYILM